MTFEADLYAHLLGDAAITAMTGSRVYPVLRPQDSAFPAVVYTRVSGTPQQSLDGFTSGLNNFRMQLDCYATRFDQCRLLAEAVQSRMLTAAVTFKSVMVFDQDFYEPDDRLFKIIMDFSCWYPLS